MKDSRIRWWAWAFVAGVVAVGVPSQANAGFIEFFDNPSFRAAVPDVSIVGFDDVAARSLLSGTEFAGFTISSRRITVINPQDFAPGLIVGGQNVNSQPNGISASLFYAPAGGSISFDNGNDNFLISLSEPRRAAGLWVGNLGAFDGDLLTPTLVEFLDASGLVLASEELRQGHLGVIGSGANNRIFYGITSDTPINSIRVTNSAGDGDGIILDDVQFQHSQAVPEPSSLALVGVGIGCLVVSWRRRHWNLT